MSRFEVTVTKRDVKPLVGGVSGCKCSPVSPAGRVAGESPDRRHADGEATRSASLSPLSD